MRSLLISLLVLGACSPSSTQAPPSAPASSPRGSQPKGARDVQRGHFAFSWRQLCTIPVGADSPCRFNAVAASDQGLVAIGGEAYPAIEFAGERRPKRAYPQGVIGVFDHRGTPRWLETFGAQWGNHVSHLMFMGDTLYVTGVHNNNASIGGQRLPNTKHRSGRHHEATNGFIAAFSAAGELRWAFDFRALVDGEQGRVTPEYHHSLFAGEDGHVWVSFQDEGSSRYVVRLSPEGRIAEQRSAPGIDNGPKFVRENRFILPDGTELYLAAPLCNAGSMERARRALVLFRGRAPLWGIERRTPDETLYGCANEGYVGEVNLWVSRERVDVLFESTRLEGSRADTKELDNVLQTVHLTPEGRFLARQRVLSVVDPVFPQHSLRNMKLMVRGDRLTVMLRGNGSYRIGEGDERLRLDQASPHLISWYFGAQGPWVIETLDPPDPCQPYAAAAVTAAGDRLFAASSWGGQRCRAKWEERGQGLFRIDSALGAGRAPTR